LQRHAESKSRAGAGQPVIWTCTERVLRGMGGFSETVAEVERNLLYKIQSIAIAHTVQLE